MAPGDLQEVLAGLRPAGRATPPDLLVGLGAADDAAVYRITPDVAIVETLDFFPPVVDDPWTWGAVAAANAMSDVYAMGGEVLFALAIAGFPRELPKDVIVEVFRGGSEKMAEAGGVIAGGHTVVDPEPKYGLCVTGRVHPDRILVKGGRRGRDRGRGREHAQAEPGRVRGGAGHGRARGHRHHGLRLPRARGRDGDRLGRRARDPRGAPAAAPGHPRARRGRAVERRDEAQPPPRGRRLRRAAQDRPGGARLPRLAADGVGDLRRPALLGRPRAGAGRARRLQPARRGVLGSRPRDPRAGHPRPAQ